MLGDGGAFRLRLHALRCMFPNPRPARQRQGLGWRDGTAVRLRPHSLIIALIPDLNTRERVWGQPSGFAHTLPDFHLSQTCTPERGFVVGDSLRALPTLSLSCPNPRPAHQREGSGGGERGQPSGFAHTILDVPYSQTCSPETGLGGCLHGVAFNHSELS